MNLLDHALKYHDYGWSVIPIKPGTKEPACRSWKPYASDRPSVTKLRKWFTNGKNSAAIIAGPVSGGLVVRDFDDLDSYHTWAENHPELAESLPTVETGRPGRHVYFKTKKKYGIVHVGNGEGEVRGNGYSVAPPSIHTGGKPYRWLIEPTSEIPFIEDLDRAGLLGCNREDRDNRDNRGVQREQKTLSNKHKRSNGSLLDSAEVTKAINDCLPTKTSQRHKVIFELARSLKAIPGLAAADPNDLEEVFREWHRQAKPYINTKAFEESWFDFREGWPKVKFPKGQEPLLGIWEKSMHRDYPVEAQGYENPKIKDLARFCRELQLVSGQEPFFLAVRVAGRLLDVDKATASRLLRILQCDGIIELVSKGSQAARRASRYRYVASLGGTVTTSLVDSESAVSAAQDGLDEPRVGQAKG